MSHDIYCNYMKLLKTSLVILSLTLTASLQGQERLSLEDCRRMAISNNSNLEQARINIDMAHADKAIARSNYFPKISASGTYLYNTMDIALISDDMSAMLQNSGSMVQSSLASKVETLTQTIMSNPALAMEYMQSPMWQTVLGALSTTDVSQTINGLGSQIDELLHPDTHNILMAGISVQQPLFVGGKIIASNRIAALAEELAKSKYDTEYAQAIVDIDQAYWQIVSIAAKKELARDYANLLSTMQHDVEVSVEEGVATQSDALTIKVKANEAEMMLTKATNGLSLAKMLLCKMIGLPLDSEIMLADEGCEQIDVPSARPAEDMATVMALRPELRSLDLATQIYEKKVTVARADFLPQLALTGNYFLTSPSMANGFSTDLNGFFMAGVSLKVPLFHGLEGVRKTQKAKLEAQIYKSKFDDSVKLVNLEISQLHSQMDEAGKRLEMAKSNLDSAEENLRAATLGFEEGIIESSTALAAQTAWLQAHNECIDAGIELLMTDTKLNRAEGKYNSEK